MSASSTASVATNANNIISSVEKGKIFEKLVFLELRGMEFDCARVEWVIYFHWVIV